MGFVSKKVSAIGYDKVIDEVICDKNKKILLYGAGESFFEFAKKYPQFIKELNIVAIADKKFTEEGTFKGIKTIAPETIVQTDFDMIVITLDRAEPIIKYLREELKVTKEIKPLVVCDNNDEIDFVNYLEKYDFEKSLEKMNKKFKNKKVMLYGAGLFFDVLSRYYDLSGLNIIGIADKRFETDTETKEFNGYKTFAPHEIQEANPDYVLVSTLSFVNIVDYLASCLLKKTKIKVKPLVTLPLLTLIKEIWNS